jgi:hypothetical protein
VIPGEDPEPVVLRTPAERPKPRVLDLVRVQTATRDGFEIRYNARVRKEFQHRVGAALAFCPTRDDAEETRHHLYAAYLLDGSGPVLAGYRRLFVTGSTREPIRLVNEVMLTRREPVIYVQKAIGLVASYRVFRYPYSKDERFVVASVRTDEADYRRSYFIDHHEDIVADVQVLGDTEELLGLSWFDDPVAHVEWNQERQRYQCRAALIGHESLDALESETLEEAIEQCLGELERLLAKGPVAKFPPERTSRWGEETKKPRRRKAKARAGGSPARVVFYEMEPDYAHLDYAQACAYFVQDVDLCERCHLYLAYLELQERLEDLEPFLRSALPVECDALADIFVAGVKLALKSVGVFCKSCEKRLLDAAQRGLLPLVLRDAEQAEWPEP